MARTPCPYDYPNNCSCTTCKGDRRGGGRTRSGGSRCNRGLVADTALAATSLVGPATNPTQPPSTDQLNDVHTTKVTGYRQSIEEKSRNQGTNTSQSR